MTLQHHPINTSIKQIQRILFRYLGNSLTHYKVKYTKIA